MESANVVGFQNKSAEVSGWTWMAATFKKVDGSKMKLKDFTTATPMAVGAFSLALLDSKGATKVDPDTGKTMQFKYVNPGYYDTATYHAGWYYFEAKTADMKNATFNENMFAGEVEIPYGTGIGINRPGANVVTLVFSGEVAAKDPIIEAKTSGWTWTGIVVPSNGLKLKDLTTVEPMAVGAFSIALLDSKGATKIVTEKKDETEIKRTQQFKYVNPAYYDTTTYHAGWYYFEAKTADMKNATFNPDMLADDIPLAAGDGFGINRPGANVVELVIPSPLVDANAK